MTVLQCHCKWQFKRTYTFNSFKTFFFSPIFSMPITFVWDNADPRILACEIRRLNQSNDKKPPTSMSTMHAIDKQLSPSHLTTNIDQASDSQIAILFTTNDVRNIIKPMEYLNLDFSEELIDFLAPHVVCT